MLQLMTPLDLPSSGVLLHFTCIIMLFFPSVLCPDYTQMHSHPCEVIETGYFGEEEVALLKCHGC